MNKEDGNKLKGMASNSKDKEIPRYLRASTGSCHDFCKYGKKQETPQEKPWRSTAKKVVKPGAAKVKKTMESEIIKREVVKHQVNGGVSSGLKKQEGSILSSGDETPAKMSKKSMTSSSKLKPSLDSGSRSSGNGNAIKLKVLTKSYSAMAMLKSKLANEQVVSRVLKPKVGKKEEDTKAKVFSRVVSKNVPLTPRASLSPRLSLRLAGSSSLRKSQSTKDASFSSSRLNRKPRNVNRADESNEYPVEEKTLHVVEIETSSKVSDPDQNQECFIEPLSNIPSYECSASETGEFEYTSGSNEVESVEEEKKPRARKEYDSLDEDAKKLQFRRGKVVDAEIVGESARKLKFRRGSGLGEDKAQDGQGRRSFKKREDNRDEVVEEGDDGEKVVLRHQDVQEKDAQGLFNNVIEETASKLVEARKSKVKALVGAFETVISLQESKPIANSEIGNVESS